MDKLSQVRGVLRGIKSIAVQGIYADTFKGIEAQCVSTYRKCIATLKTIEGYEDTEGLAPELTDNATMQEIGFAVEMVLNLISEGNAAAMNSAGMRGWDWKARHMPPIPPTPPIPPLPPMPPMPGGRHMRSLRHHMRQHVHRACRPGRGSSAEHNRRLEELQDEMQEKIEEEQERFEENVESMEDKMEELQEKIEEMRERLQERLEEIREKYEEKVEEIQEAAEEAEEEAEEEDEDEDVDEPKA